MQVHWPRLSAWSAIGVGALAAVGLPWVAWRLAAALVTTAGVLVLVLPPWQRVERRAQRAWSRRRRDHRRDWAYSLADDRFIMRDRSGRLPHPARLLEATGATDAWRADAQAAAAGQPSTRDVEQDGIVYRITTLQGAYKGLVVGHVEEASHRVRAGRAAVDVVEAFPGAACLVDAEGRVVASSEAWADATGTDAPAGGPLETPDGSELPARLMRCLRSGDADDLDVTMRGEPFRVQIRTLHITDGRAALLVACSLEEEHRMQRSLRALSTRLKALMQHTPVPIVIHDRHGRVMDWSQAAEATFGWTPDEAQGRVLPATPPGREMEFEDWLHGAVLTTTKGVEVMRVQKDGTFRAYECYTAPLRDEAGLCTGFVALYVDPTDRDRAQQSERKLEELRSMDALKSTFLSTAAHELATPLTPLKLQLHTLLAKAGDGDRNLAILARNVARMERLVRDILDAARLESERMVIQKGQVETGPLVDGCLSIFEEAAREKGVALVAAAEELIIDGDPVRMDQVLTNLISNAVKFTPTGGRVQVRVEADSGGALITVQDSGMGMEPEQLEQLFQPFMQFHRERTGAHVGTGLGLYISRGIVQAHGGWIRASSAGHDKGTRFSIWLPAHIPGELEGPMLMARKT